MPWPSGRPPDRQTGLTAEADIDAKNIEWARNNVQLNGLTDRIRILPRTSADPLVLAGGDAEGLPTVDFVMMNPPFYASEDEMEARARAKARPPHSACTGAPVEMVCEGGELAHASRLVAESLALRGRVQWYTTMLGLASTVEALVGQLREAGINNYAISELVQGRKTRRWVLGWSFGPLRPAQHVARGLKAGTWRKLLPPVSETDLLTGPIAGSAMAATLAGQLRTAVEVLELASWEWDCSNLQGVGRTRGDVWSRAWRRKQQQGEAGGHAAGR